MRHYIKVAQRVSVAILRTVASFIFPELMCAQYTFSTQQTLTNGSMLTTAVTTVQPRHASQQAHAHRGNTSDHYCTQERNAGTMVNWLAMLLDWQVQPNRFVAVTCHGRVLLSAGPLTP